MVCNRAALFRGRHFTDEIIVLCVRWYLRYSLSYRDLTEIMCERNLSIDPSTIWRWVQRYAPELNERLRRELKPTNGSWRTDETYVRVAGRWTYLYRAVDSTGATIDDADQPPFGQVSKGGTFRIADEQDTIHFAR